MDTLPDNLYAAAYHCLMIQEPELKCRAVTALRGRWSGHMQRDADYPLHEIPDPGRPAHPELVPPRDVPRRKLTSNAGRAALVHALTHIEFNAINLALDVVYRFRDMPNEFYVDWLKVAAEEAYHFSLLNERLNELNQEYGDFSAHNGLWEMAVKTADDVLVRMALVPRVLEARGLDVTPGMIERLQQVGDERSADILRIILRDEIGHVAIGSRWYLWACKQRGLEPEPTFRGLIEKHVQGQLRGPFDYEARIKAGFSEDELQALELLGSSTV